MSNRKRSVRRRFIQGKDSDPMTPTITAFERSPDRGKGLARDMRVRWALEEVGQPYEVRLVSFGAMKEPGHQALHPFGQIPTYEEGDLVLFESGAIVFHIAERHAGLLPDDANARARAITWMFAALNTVEPPILDLQTTRFLEGDKPWYKQRLPFVEDRIRDRLGELSGRLGDADWLDGAFSAGDIRGEIRIFVQHTRCFQPEQHRHHHQVARAECTIEPVGIAKATGKFAQPVTDAVLDERQALLVPGLVALQEPGGLQIKDRRLNRVERSKHPCDRARPSIRIVGQQAC